MNKLISVLVVLASFSASSLLVASSPQTGSILRREFEIPIRVLLEEKPDKHTHWLVESTTPCTVYGIINGERLLVTTSDSIKLVFSRNAFLVNGKKQVSDTFFIKPQHPDGLIKFNGNTYKGALVFIKKHQTIYIVNHIDLEDYVTCVLPSESWPGWPEEFNKAFCIVVRTYAIAKILEERSRRAKRRITVPYDIKPTNIHQTYRGYKACAQMGLYKKVSRDTRGIILAFTDKTGAKKPILAMFDASCGGVIPAKIEGVNFEKAPYLARPYACTYCKDYKLTNWVQEYHIRDLETLLKKEFPKLTRLSDIKIAKKDRAGMVTEVKLKTHTWLILLDTRITSTIKGLKSRRFTIDKKGTKITFKGIGYGHCLGLCQWGARKMIELGWKAKNILEFFYPNIFFMRLTRTASLL